MKNEGAFWSSSFMLSKFYLKRLKHFPLDMQKISHLTKPHQYQNSVILVSEFVFRMRTLPVVLWKYDMEIQNHSCSIKQIFSVGNWYLHHSKNAGNARKAGTFRGNLKSHPDSQHIRNNECLHFHWFVCSRIAIHYLSIFWRNSILKFISKTLFCEYLKSLTHSYTAWLLHAETDFYFLSYGKKSYYFVTLSICKVLYVISETFWILKWSRSRLIFRTSLFLYNS